MKRCVFVCLCVVAVVGLATPAPAKGVRDATIKGPRFTEPLVIDRSTVIELTQTSMLYVATSHQPATAVMKQRPPGRLGPRYVVTWGWLVAAERTKPVRQMLYPFAEGGALSYVPPGQRLSEQWRLKGGWLRVGQRLTDVLTTLGEHE
jgi:hypothetical protein